MMLGFAVHDSLRKWMDAPRFKVMCHALVLNALGIFLGALNGLPDMHYSVLHQPILYYLSASLQSCTLILLCAYWGQHSKLLSFFGRNSLIVMATHYTFPFIRYASAWLAPVKTGIRYADDFLILAVVMAMESVVIVAIHRFLPFLLAPHRHKEKQTRS